MSLTYICTDGLYVSTLGGQVATILSRGYVSSHSIQAYLARISRTIEALTPSLSRTGNNAAIGIVPLPLPTPHGVIRAATASGTLRRTFKRACQSISNFRQLNNSIVAVGDTFKLERQSWNSCTVKR